MLVLIQFEASIGYAVGRLVGIFHQMAVRATGDANAVHFGFARVGNERSRFLPPGFERLVEFDVARYGPADLERLAAYVQRHDIDTLFAFDLHPGAGFLPALRRAGIRHVVSYFGAPLSSVNAGLKLLLKRLELRLRWPAQPDLYILESEAMRQTATHGRGIPAARTAVVATGVDVNLFRPLATPTLVREKFSIPDARRIIVFMGHLHRRKGVHVLLQAADLLVRQRGRRDLHFLMLGNRPDEPANFQDCYSGEAASHITFGGYQSNIPELLSGCHLGCIPTTGWDSRPLSPSEMQACGLPVIVTDCQGLPETVDANRTGLVVPAGDVDKLAEAIVSLLDDEPRRAAMSVAAVERIRNGFSAELQVERLRAAMTGLWTRH
jgi:glycosyltransferase involved in cell wall biosynthesis